MAAGGGSGVAFMGVNNLSNTNGTNGFSATGETESSMSAGLRALRIDTTVPPSDDEVGSAVSEGTSASASDSGEYGTSSLEDREVWNGVMSAVVGLQKRGLRGLMEGRRIREMGRGGRERRDASDAGMNGEGVGLGLI